MNASGWDGHRSRLRGSVVDMKDLSPSEITQRQLDELFENIKSQGDLHRDASRRWAFSLAVANAGALAAFGSKLIDGTAGHLTALAVPSCWLFAVGLLAAGALNPIVSKRHRLSRDVWRGHLKNFRKGLPLVEPTEAESGEGLLLRAEILFEWIAALCFAAGLTRPLAILTLRFFDHGTFV